MKKILLATMILCSAAAFAETWNSVSLMDNKCAAKMASTPDSHMRSCALQCAAQGYGIQTSDGKYLKFDKNGNDQALKLLKASSQNDHLRVRVDGTLQGDTIAVKSVSF
jgi:hypothetical protein